jgi:hypothetical protein
MLEKTSARKCTEEGEHTGSCLFGFADDTALALIFETQANLQEGTGVIISTFEAIGLS